MLPAELTRKIRHLEIHTRRKANDLLSGGYRSSFKGRGMEFDEVREYQPGDEVRSIDWNVTARLGHPYVKRFVEERQTTVLLAVDLSASGGFGSGRRSKNEVAAELCALLAFSAIKNNDKVGVVAFTDRIELFIPPAKGSTHVLRIIRDILQFEPQGRGTDIGGALDYIHRILRKRGIVFLVSDFIAGGDYDRPLRVLSRRHDAIAVFVHDPREQELPGAGLVELEDAETGETVLLDSSSPAVRRRFAEMARQRQEQLADRLKKISVDLIPVRTDQDYLRSLVAFFRKRERRQVNA